MASTPLPDRVDTGGQRGWRIAQGKILRGRRGEEEERPALLGYLRRIGVHFGTLDDGREYGKLEAELECNGGMETVSTNLVNAETGKPTLASSISFAEGLLWAAKDELIQVEAKESSKENRYGTRSTYARVTLIDPITLRAKPFAKSESPDWSEDYLDDLIEQIKSHPAYAERPKRDGGPTHRSELNKELAAKGWPNPDEAPDEWNKLLRAFMKDRPKVTITDLDDHEWGQVRQQIGAAKSCPKILEPALSKVVAKPDEAKPDEYDPFA